MRRGGFTLIEMLIVSVLVVAVSGLLFQVFISANDTAALLHLRASADDDAYRAASTISRELRQADWASVSAEGGPRLTYGIPVDADGNGFADMDGGRAASRVIMRDESDANADGFAADQLVLVEGPRVRVLANGLREDEDLNGNGQLDAGEDIDGNGVLDRGFEVERSGSTVRLTVQTQRRTRKGLRLFARVSREVRGWQP